jgi:chromosome segregation ATPase
LSEADDSGIRARGEEALSDLAQALAENPIVGGALARALGAGERAAVAQRQALGALNLASSADVERLELRLRSLSSRLEAMEDAMDDLRDSVSALKAQAAARDQDA